MFPAVLPCFMHYDAVIIGAGMSGLAAGSRLAYFGLRVCLVEKHYAYGGLNSYYRLHGRSFDVGLHAVTNFVPPGTRNAPLPKLLRQLRLTREDFGLEPQRFSEIRFPGRRLRFTNHIDVLIEEVSREFPRDAENFRRFLERLREYDDVRLDQPYQSARAVLTETLTEPVLIEMLLCPVMYYGSAQEHDMDFTQFVTMFKALFLEGFARPRGGVRTIIRALVKKYRACGGKLWMNKGVERIRASGGRAVGLILCNGEELTADYVLSSAGYFETLQLCSDMASAPPSGDVGRVSFVETIGILDTLPQTLGHEATIVFFNDAETFTYAVPTDFVDLRSGVVCCPSNYEKHDDMREGIFRVTWLANAKAWMHGDESRYREMKAEYQTRFVEFAEKYLAGFGDHLLCTDMFTPRTIHRYTGHLNGAVYGTPRKIRDGRTHLENLFLCGTDQGFLGIIGAMLSGITMANLHVLSNWRG